MVIVLRKKYLIFSVLLCFIIGSVLIGTKINLRQQSVVASKSVNNNWGLSFSNKGEAPTGNASKDFLKQYDAYYLGNTDENKIYLTFDAGFENGYTPKILDTLKKNNVKATFFLVGNYIKTSPDLVKRMVDEGHTVGNHTFSHPDMSKISDMESFKKEITELENLYKETTGKDMLKYYRPPQGKYNEENLKHAQKLGYKTIFWSLAYVDWLTDKQPSKEHAFDKLSRIHKGAVILLHSTSKTNVEILDELINKWKSEGYEFGSIDELCNN